jgi:hypothetical protein
MKPEDAHRILGLTSAVPQDEVAEPETPAEAAPAPLAAPQPGPAAPETEAATVASVEAPPAEPSQSDTTTGSAGPRERYVKTDAIKHAAQGRGVQVLHAIGVSWPPARGDHVLCPHRNHDDHDPSWRWDEQKECAFCTCEKGLSIFDVVMRVEGITFEAAKIRVAEIIGRLDLIIEPAAPKGVTLEQLAEAKKLPVKLLRDSGMYTLRRSGKFHTDAVAMPYRERGSDRQWLRIRTGLDGDKKKKFRWRTGDKEASLYGAWEAAHLSAEGFVVLVGGETDTLTCWHHGVAALGLPGEGNWNEERHASLLDGVPVIYVIIEPDQGGKAMMRWVARSRIAPRVLLVFMPPETKDPSALHIADPENFKTAFRALLDAAEQFDPQKHAPVNDQDERPKRRSAADGGVASPKRGLPVIEYAGGRLSSATDEAERLLAESDDAIFQRSDFLVRLGFNEEMTTADGTTTKGPRLVRVEAMHMQDRLTRCIDFQAYDERMDDFKSINCPPDVARALLQRKGLWRYLPVIAGITTAPTLRVDGSILDEPGYDPATRVLYIRPESVTYPEIPREPTKDDARVALDALCDLVSEFPFVAENGDDASGKPSPSRSVALSGFMTPQVRRALAAAPLHAFDATAAGSGKSKLVSIASVIARGHEAPVTSGASTNPEEFEKKISAALIAGDSIVAIDNLEGQLNSELLCSATTEAMLNIRVLGLSKNVVVPNGAAFFATGNSLVIVGDMVRRAIVARLDPRVERPELRTFHGEDPVLRAKRDRALYVAATLTVLRAFHCAGRPRQSDAALGSFTEWSDWVREALIWLGEPDPCLTMELTRQQDPRRNALAAVLHQWRAAVGDSEVSVKRLIEIAIERESLPPGNFNTPGLKYPDLREALLVVAGDKGNVNSARLGQWLSRRKGQVIERLRIEQGISMEHGAVRWKVVPV